MWITGVTWVLLGVCVAVAGVAAALSSGRRTAWLDDPYPSEDRRLDAVQGRGDGAVMESHVTPDIEWVPKSTTPGPAADDTPATGAGASREEE